MELNSEFWDEDLAQARRSNQLNIRNSIQQKEKDDDDSSSFLSLDSLVLN